MDPVSLVERAYDFPSDDQSWLASITAAARPLLEARGGRGVLAMLIDDGRATVGDPGVLALTQDGLPEDVLPSFAAMLGAGLSGDAVRRLRASGPASTASKALGELFDADDGLGPLLRTVGLADNYWISARDPSRVACVLMSPTSTRESLSDADTELWGHIAAHIATARRLRHREPLSAGQDGEAVIDPDGKILHAEPEAQHPEAQAALRRAALDVIRARGHARANPAEALDLWVALVSGRWSLVDRFDNDGRRFLIARLNEPQVALTRGLTSIEQQVAALVGLGHSNKLIAYQLGQPISTVAGTLAGVLRKLNLDHRAHLVELFARSLP
ncbi:MAG: hypothetical protein JNM17_29395 [Archangium sp.]|nr:hypothetical protein [Archangium sp.]